MSILDDAIREHLELKRAHGADATELKKLEDEAFGPPARPDEPDPLAEAPTEFLTPEGAEAQSEAGTEPAGRRVPNIADLQEAPEPRKEEAPQVEEEEEAAEADEPQAEEQPIPAPEPDPAHSTGEREAIAEQPTEHFDVEAEMENNGGVASPSDEELIDAEMSEPLAPVDPLAGIEATSAEPEISEAPLAEDEEDDDFFSEQRLSDELSQALDTPIEGEPEMPQTDEHAAPPVEEARPLEEVEHDEAEEYEEDDDEPRPAASDQDVLEGTPEFLEDAPEDDDLWFEQRPPKDFDFDD